MLRIRNVPLFQKFAAPERPAPQPAELPLQSAELVEHLRRNLEPIPPGRISEKAPSSHAIVSDFARYLRNQGLLDLQAPLSREGWRAHRELTRNIGVWGQELGLTSDPRQAHLPRNQRSRHAGIPKEQVKELFDRVHAPDSPLGRLFRLKEPVEIRLSPSVQQSAAFIPSSQLPIAYNTVFIPKDSLATALHELGHVSTLQDFIRAMSGGEPFSHMSARDVNRLNRLRALAEKLDGAPSPPRLLLLQERLANAFVKNLLANHPAAVRQVFGRTIVPDDYQKFIHRQYHSYRLHNLANAIFDYSAGVYDPRKFDYITRQLVEKVYGPYMAAERGLPLVDRFLQNHRRMQERALRETYGAPEQREALRQLLDFLDQTVHATRQQIRNNMRKNLRR